MLLLCWLFLASGKWVWWKASAFSLLLLTLSAWWLIDKLSGDGLNAATLYHRGADMEGAGVSDFKGKYYQMEDCLVRPNAAGVKLICAGSSDPGLAFTAQYADYAFALGDW